MLSSQHRGIDETCHDGIRSDSLRRVLQRDGDRRLVHAGLRRVIGELWIARVTDRRQGRDVDDGPAALVNHDWQHGLAGQIDARQIQVDGTVPLLFR